MSETGARSRSDAVKQAVSRNVMRRGKNRMNQSIKRREAIGNNFSLIVLFSLRTALIHVHREKHNMADIIMKNCGNYLMRQQIIKNWGSFTFSIFLMLLQPFVLTKVYPHVNTARLLRGDDFITPALIVLLSLFAFFFWRTFINTGKTYAKNHLMIVASLLAYLSMILILDQRLNYRRDTYYLVLMLFFNAIILFHIFQSRKFIHFKNIFLSRSLRTMYFVVYFTPIFLFTAFIVLLVGCTTC